MRSIVVVTLQREHRLRPTPVLWSFLSLRGPCWRLVSLATMFLIVGILARLLTVCWIDTDYFTDLSLPLSNRLTWSWHILRRLSQNFPTTKYWCRSCHRLFPIPKHRNLVQCNAFVSVIQMIKFTPHNRLSTLFGGKQQFLGDSLANLFVLTVSTLTRTHNTVSLVPSERTIGAMSISKCGLLRVLRFAIRFAEGAEDFGAH